MEKDKRYKYLVQVLVGQDQGQGIQMGTRQFWDPELDHVVNVAVRKQNFFVVVIVFVEFGAPNFIVII